MCPGDHCMLQLRSPSTLSRKRICVTWELSEGWRVVHCMTPVLSTQKWKVPGGCVRAHSETCHAPCDSPSYTAASERLP